jgi:predicted N-acetyltransferase YhbS
VLFRAEEAGDIPAIRGMIARIMRPQTADLVDRIRGSGRYIPELSRVAVGDDGEIVGFVMLSRLDVLGDRPLERPNPGATGRLRTPPKDRSRFVPHAGGAETC